VTAFALCRRIFGALLCAGTGHTNYALTLLALINTPEERAVAVITALAMHVA